MNTSGFLQLANHVTLGEVCESINHPALAYEESGMYTCIIAWFSGNWKVLSPRGSNLRDANGTIAHNLKTDQNQSAAWL